MLSTSPTIQTPNSRPESENTFFPGRTIVSLPYETWQGLTAEGATGAVDIVNRLQQGEVLRVDNQSSEYRTYLVAHREAANGSLICAASRIQTTRDGRAPRPVIPESEIIGNLRTTGFIYYPAAEYALEYLKHLGTEKPGGPGCSFPGAAAMCTFEVGRFLDVDSFLQKRADAALIDSLQSSVNFRRIPDGELRPIAKLYKTWPQELTRCAIEYLAAQNVQLISYRTIQGLPKYAHKVIKEVAGLHGYELNSEIRTLTNENGQPWISGARYTRLGCGNLL